MRIDLARAGGVAPSPAPAGPPTSKYCGAGSAGIAIDPFGNIYPCVAWRRAAGNLHEHSVRELWGTGFDDVREATTDAKAVISAHPNGKLLNFCPGLAANLTGSPLQVPVEMERIASIVREEVSAILP